MRARATRRAFTLLETALTLVIIAVGVLAVVEAQQYFMQDNRWSSHAASGTFLANEIRELTRPLPRHDPVSGLTIVDGAVIGWGAEAAEVAAEDFDDVDDFDGMSFRFDGTPAGDADGQPVLDEISVYYAKLLRDHIKAVTSMIEPIMIIVMGTVVGFIAMAIILPIFKMSQVVS